MDYFKLIHIFGVRLRKVRIQRKCLYIEYQWRAYNSGIATMLS